MPKLRTLTLTNDAKAELIDMRDRAEKPYLRERASAILQVAAGHAASWVARCGLLKERKPDTIYSWLNRYEEEGVSGLHNRPRCGRPAAFEP